MGGIVDLDVRFPASRISAKEMHAASGVSLAEIMEVTQCEQFPVLGEFEQAWELAVEAADAVLTRTQVDPSAIRLVIYAGAGQWDRPIWSPAGKVADELGIDRAHCFEITNGCNGGMTAVQVALDKIALGYTEYALVLLGERLSHMVDRSDPDSKGLFNYGDAAAAVLLGRDGCAFEVLRSAMRTDPSWSDYFSGEHEEHRVVLRRRSRRQGLGDAYVENFAALVEEVLTALGKAPADVAYLLINQSERRMHERVLRAVGIPAARSVFNYHRLGHMGGADTLIALQDLVAQRILRRGDLILLATSGRGFSWGVTAVEYQG
jgi:3-oxoacyl-[acyl-carrier-protein] synthase-3